MAAGLDTDGEDARTIDLWKLIEALLLRLDAWMRETGIPWLLVWQGAAEGDYHVARWERLVEKCASSLSRYQPICTR